MNATNTQLAPKSFRIITPRLHLPVMRGVIDRRMLVNFRCEPAALAWMLEVGAFFLRTETELIIKRAVVSCRDVC